MLACLVLRDVLGFDDAASLVYEYATFDADVLDFVLEDGRVNKDAAADKEFCARVDEARRNHPDAV